MGGERFRALLIAGPTASGKSALALDLAERLGAWIVNADSMQVYRDLRVITARPTPQDEGRAPHSLFGFVDAAVNFSVGLWLAEARRVAELARNDKKMLIFVGGTGLYLKALTQGIADLPPVPEEVRERVRREARDATAMQLYLKLSEQDPRIAEKLRPTDRQRIIRALEFAAATGRSLAEGQAGPAEAATLRPGEWYGVFLAPDRAKLREAIDRRFDAMIAAGALDEARALAERRLDPALPAMRAHGIPGLLAYLRGETGLDQAIARGKSDTRRYVKRQFTFARTQIPDLRPLAPEQAEGQILGALGA